MKYKTFTVICLFILMIMTTATGFFVHRVLGIVVVIFWCYRITRAVYELAKENKEI